MDEETKESILREISALFPNVSDSSFFRQIFDSENWDLEKSVQTIQTLLEGFDDGSSLNASSIKNNFETGGSSQCTTTWSNIVPSAPPQPHPLSFGNYSSALKNDFEKTGTIPKASNASKDVRKAPVASKAGKREQLVKVYNNALRQRNQIHRITSFTLEGIKVMVLMRGCPGSGKTFLVNSLATNLSTELSKSLNSLQQWPVQHHIFSADDFWVNPRTGKYVFDAEFIEYAHLWNQKLVRQAASEGRSPLFIDNTHTRMWEMKAYAAIAVEFGYVVEIIESPNKWAFNENELVRRNVHGVHRDAIRRMLDRYEYHITPNKLLLNNHFSYHQSLTPPQRCLVSFNTPPSKNQMKIYNSTFYCVSLDSIRSLKSPPGTVDDPFVQFTKPLQPVTNNSLSKNLELMKVQGSPNSRNAQENAYFTGDSNLYSNPSPLTTKDSHKEKATSQKSSLQRNEAPEQAMPNSINYFWDMLAQPVKPESDLTIQKPKSSTDSPALENKFFISQKLREDQSMNYFWDMPAQPEKPQNDKTGQMQNSSIDPPSKNPQVLLDMTYPQSSTEIAHQVSNFFQSYPLPKEVVDDQQGDLNSYPSDSSVDLLSFENIEVPSTSSSSDKSEPTSPKAVDEFIEPIQSSQLIADYCSSKSSCNEVFSDESGESTSEGSSYEEVSLTSRNATCDEFGNVVTQEYVLVQPTGAVVYQTLHEGFPNTLRGFVASSALLSLQKKKGSQRSIGRNLLANVNKLIHLPLKSRSSVYIDDLSTSANVSNDSAQSLNTKQNHELVSKSNIGGNVPVPIYESEDLPPDPLSSCVTSPPLPSSFTSNLSSQTDYFMSSDNFEPGLADLANTWNEDPVKESSPGPFTRSESPKAQRSVSKPSLAKSSPGPFTRSESPKAQRSVSKPSLAKSSPGPFPRSESPKDRRSVSKPSSAKTSRDSSCNTNYIDFDILNKVNSGNFTGGNVVLVGHSKAFRGSSTTQKSDYIKAIATHDKSSMTSSELPTIGKDSGMEILTKMFPEAPTAGLAELFDKCCKDLDWAVNLMIDSGNQVSEHFVADEVELQPSSTDPSEPENNEENVVLAPLCSGSRKIKKNKHKLTEEYSDLVKEFEANFVLSEGCYSERLKKVRETKFGKPLRGESLEDEQSTRESSPSNDPESSCSDSCEEDEGDVDLVMSNTFMAQLQCIFGRIPNLNGDDLMVKLPVCLARQIYSYALDSICQHMEKQQHVDDMLVKEDEEFARKLQDEPSKPNGDVSFQEIMDYEIALRTQKKLSQSGVTNEPTFASMLSHQLLTERFPGIDPATLKTVLDETNQSLHQATNLLAFAGHVPVSPSVQEPQNDLQDEDLGSSNMSKDEIITQANTYREVALKLTDLRQHYFLKVQESYNSGKYAVAAFYRDLVDWYTSRITESNSEAAKMMLYGGSSSPTLDLHFLSVSDAVHILDVFLDEAVHCLRTRKREIFIITGRGQHSTAGRSKIKPAVLQKLKRRGLKFSEVNPGMLKTVITKSSIVSNTTER